MQGRRRADRRRSRGARSVAKPGREANHEGLVNGLRLAADRVAEGLVLDGCYMAFALAAPRLPDVAGFGAVRWHMQRAMEREQDANGRGEPLSKLTLHEAAGHTLPIALPAPFAGLRIRLCNLFETFDRADIVTSVAVSARGEGCRGPALDSLIDMLHEGLGDLRGAAIAGAFVAFTVMLPDGAERLQSLEAWIAERETKLTTNGVEIACAESASEIPADPGTGVCRPRNTSER